MMRECDLDELLEEESSNCWKVLEDSYFPEGGFWANAGVILRRYFDFLRVICEVGFDLGPDEMDGASGWWPSGKWQISHFDAVPGFDADNWRPRRIDMFDRALIPATQQFL